MASVRKIVIGGIDGELVTLATEWIVTQRRMTEVKSVKTYQHKHTEADTVPFLDVYSADNAIAQKAIGTITNYYAVFPEKVLGNLSLKLLVVQETSRTSSRHYAKGIVVFKHAHGNYRVSVEITKRYTDNGNNYKNESSCRFLNGQEYATALAVE